MGILCRHVLCVFGKKSKLDRLSQHYILERWAINAKSRPIPDISCFDDPTMRKSKLMMQFYDIVELGSQSKGKFNHLSLALEKVYKELLAMDDHVDRESTNDSYMLRCQVESNFLQTVQDHPRVPTKRRPKSLRAKNPKETASTKKKCCGICKNEGHVRNNSPSMRDLGPTTPNISQHLDS
ncbi:hypothetical protein F2P56_013547 [Juglans regia]|uniref:Protein FAR1-RELATED SEQUENCE n=1 Tax=Juglans regia TaxID=51240 RepID=A0A833XLQ8_JUGRE|nr:hypothetical protein F2P56_013547 [Juglans regia]